jgi:hypothetical protein
MFCSCQQEPCIFPSRMFIQCDSMESLLKGCCIWLCSGLDELLCVYFFTQMAFTFQGSVVMNQVYVFVGSTLLFRTYTLKIFTGGDAGSLYPHLYNIHPSLLTQLGSKHSRLGVHLQDQLQVRILRNCTPKCCEQRGHCGVGVSHWTVIPVSAKFDPQSHASLPLA